LGRFAEPPGVDDEPEQPLAATRSRVTIAWANVREEGLCSGKRRFTVGLA
jgi:hypothetical protein